MRAYCIEKELLLCIGCSWRDWPPPKSHGTKLSLEKIQLWGPLVQRDETLPSSPVITYTSGEAKSRRQYLHLLKSFPRLADLISAKPRSRDAGLKELANLKKLADAQTLQDQDHGCRFEGIRNVEKLTTLRPASPKSQMTV